MPRFTLLTFIIDIIYKKNWVVGIQFEKCIFFKLKKSNFFPSIDLREMLLQQKTNLPKKQKYFPNSKCIRYINKS